MKYELQTVIYLLILLTLTDFIGLSAIIKSTSTEVGPQQEGGGAYILISVIVMTLIFYVLVRFKLNKVIKMWLATAVLISLFISFSSFVPEMLALIVAIVMTVLRMSSKDIYVHDLTELFIYGGIVSLFAPLFTPLSALITLGIIAVYDYISVFVTKHMIYLAKAQSDLNLFSGLVVRNRGELAMLGGGDIAFSLLFASVVGRTFGLPYAFLSIYVTLISLSILIFLGKKDRFYPAMPFIAGGCFISYLICLI